jgi:hypothetical protein
MGEMVRMASSDSGIGEGDGREPGAYYVAARLEDAKRSNDCEVVSHECAVCGELAGVVVGDAPLAQSCAGVLCADCSGTAIGILYIPPQRP